jgi:hypothetical protein
MSAGGVTQHLPWLKRFACQGFRPATGGGEVFLAINLFFEFRKVIDSIALSVPFDHSEYLSSILRVSQCITLSIA